MVAVLPPVLLQAQEQQVPQPQQVQETPRQRTQGSRVLQDGQGGVQRQGEVQHQAAPQASGQGGQAAPPVPQHPVKASASAMEEEEESPRWRKDAKGVRVAMPGTVFCILACLL